MKMLTMVHTCWTKLGADHDTHLKHCSHLKQCFGQYYIAFLSFMRDDIELKNYSYSLKVWGTRRKMIGQGVPRSMSDSHWKVRNSYDGIIIQRNMALFFVGGW
ncbi:hypothetical protein BDA96_09G195800 [Sorghum bicolor]|jgi:hypothetical protein|uniref:Seven-in-absentia protein TRAF-like domain-containing protein n=2 Tax=Sorghum bicolor TaxID=4558 RepID=A0A194YRH7_SORBI|nr:hypothetical protein BDA96_09G195800 [Sorghum bicolor]KXG22272.1 hypothetical protein SORBI_3009G185100 [Sorghum bicolor]KXG30435.1 hypothetical protein SORBI_3004G180800 [Sorghum bicolor]